MRNKTATAAALLILAGGTWSSPANATEAPAPITVEVDHRLVTGQTESVWVPVPIPAGDYTLTIHTSDAYDGREALTAEQRARQSSERVTVLGHTTNDLDDTTQSASAAFDATVTITAPIDGFHVDHAGTGRDWDSVNVDTVTLTPVIEPEPELVEHPTPEPAADPTPTPTPAELPETPAPIPTRAQPKYTG